MKSAPDTWLVVAQSWMPCLWWLAVVLRVSKRVRWISKHRIQSEARVLAAMGPKEMTMELAKLKSTGNRQLIHQHRADEPHYWLQRSLPNMGWIRSSPQGTSGRIPPAAGCYEGLGIR